VSLQVFTGRIWCGDPDALNATRKSGGAAGEPFAPSWAILRPALEARRRGADAAERAWADYVPAYLAEMRASWRAHPEAWRSLLAAREHTRAQWNLRAAIGAPAIATFRSARTDIRTLATPSARDIKSPSSRRLMARA
jgi:hypothetical protein